MVSSSKKTVSNMFQAVGEQLIEHSYGHARRRWMARGGYAPVPADRAYALASIDSSTAQKSDLPQLEINLKVRLMSMFLQMLRTNTPHLSLSAISIKDSAFETVPLFSDELVAILSPNWGICRGCPHFGAPLDPGNESSHCKERSWIVGTRLPAAQASHGVLQRRSDRVSWRWDLGLPAASTIMAPLRPRR